jgi:hypothetical protein
MPCNQVATVTTKIEQSIISDALTSDKLYEILPDLIQSELGEKIDKIEKGNLNTIYLTVKGYTITITEKDITFFQQKRSVDPAVINFKDKLLSLLKEVSNTAIALKIKNKLKNLGPISNLETMNNGTITFEVDV